MRPYPIVKRYLFAVIFVLAITGLRTVTHITAQPMGFFGVAVAIVAWRFGAGPAIVAAVVAAMSSDFFLLDPIGFSVAHNIAPLMIFIFEAVVVSLLIGRLNSQQSLARDRATRVERLYDEARMANQAKDRLLSEISHELRSPIHSMKLCLATLKSVGADRGKLEAVLERMNRSTQMQARLVEDLLDLSRLNSGKFKLNLATLPIEPLVRECADSMLPRAAEKKIELSYQADVSELHVDGDAARITQVLTNLLENAVKFTPEGGRIGVHLISRENFAVVRVSDSGIGLSPEHVRSIFEPFRQVEPAAHGGMGLGLAISKEIADLHLGSLTVHSEGIGKGAQFEFALPVRAAVAV